MIEIQNIHSRQIKDIHDLLLKQEQPFEIYIPKSTQLFASSSEDIAIDYAMLAYAGQKLSEVADEFSYYYVSPTNHESVLFEVTTKDINKLAETIFHISHGYNNELEDVVYIDEVYTFLEQIKEGVVIPVCTDFIDDYNEYSEL